jgi:hypothetical protein
MKVMETDCIVIPPSSSVVVTSKLVIPAVSSDASLTVMAPDVVFSDVPAGNDPPETEALEIAPSVSVAVARTSVLE